MFYSRFEGASVEEKMQFVSLIAGGFIFLELTVPAFRIT